MNCWQISSFFVDFISDLIDDASSVGLIIFGLVFVPFLLRRIISGIAILFLHDKSQLVELVINHPPIS